MVNCSITKELQDMGSKKKTGGPDGKYYESNETIAKFEAVKQWLLKNSKKVRVNWNVPLFF